MNEAMHRWEDEFEIAQIEKGERAFVRRGKNERTVRFEDAGDLAKRAALIGNVLDHFDQRYRIEEAVGIGGPA